MRPVSILCLLILLLTSGIQAAETQQVFDSANALYEKGQYPEALEKYRQVENTLGHWKLFYNMGNCHFKLNQYLQAKIYYLRARKLKPLHPSIEKNIGIVNRNFKTTVPEPKVDFARRLVLRLESLISVNLVSLLLIIFIFTLNVSIFLLMKAGRKRVLWYLLFFSLLLVIVGSAYHAFRTHKENNTRIAVVVQPDSQLRSGPGQDNTVLFTVHPGLEVKILESSRDWVQVSARSEIAGWIKKDDLIVI